MFTADLHCLTISFWVALQVVNFILQTMDPGNLVLRRTCLKSSMAALKEVAHVFPMVSLNETTTRLAIGDAIVNINSAKIQVYDLQRYSVLTIDTLTSCSIGEGLVCCLLRM